jgi:hypothetical protein
MLHLRLITPAEKTDAAVRLIDGTIGTTHLCVLPGAARNPSGDVVLCDVAREAADDLLSGLQRLGLDTTGSIAVENIDLSLSERADKAEKEAPGESADAVLWEHLSEATHEESTLSVTYLAFITLATMIAACGVVLDNAILIVGAMAVGPEFGPLAGISTAAVQRRPRLALRSLIALLVGFAVAMAVTVLFSLFMDAVGLFSQEQLDADRPQLVLLRGGGPGRRGRHAVADVRQVRRPGRCRHLGDDGPGRRQRRRGPELRRHRADVGLQRAAAAQPGRHHHRRHPHPADPEVPLVQAARTPAPPRHDLTETNGRPRP